jgi:hypothetical protein
MCELLQMDTLIFQREKSDVLMAIMTGFCRKQEIKDKPRKNTNC